uniref:Uncharacterized protein n=1 Tax=Anopheles minimus TaxID=112268 RepID=A0A182WQH1_9DIPT
MEQHVFGVSTAASPDCENGVHEILLLMIFCTTNLLTFTNVRLAAGFSASEVVQTFCDVAEAVVHPSSIGI